MKGARRLLEALQPHVLRPLPANADAQYRRYTVAEAQIRDAWDRFLDGLSRFAALTQSGLFDASELRPTGLWMSPRGRPTPVRAARRGESVPTTGASVSCPVWPPRTRSCDHQPTTHPSHQLTTIAWTANTPASSTATNHRKAGR